jgi:sugar (pentulose or hexulose) kinase
VSSDLLVGIDVGTTLRKAALVTLTGKEVAHGACRTPWEASRSRAAQLVRPASKTRT